MFNEGLEDLEAIAGDSYTHCTLYLEEKTFKILEINLDELREFVEIKEFDDGFAPRKR